MKIHTSLSIALCLSALSAGSLAAGVPNTFTSGDPALASEVNENFQFFMTEANKRRDGLGSTQTVDCDADSGALKKGVEAGYVRIIVNGSECIGGFDASHNLEISPSGTSPVTIKVPGTEQLSFYGGPITLTNINIVSEKTDNNPVIRTYGATLFWLGGELDAGDNSWAGYDSFGSGYSYFENVNIFCNGAQSAVTQSSGIMYLTDVTIEDGSGEGCRDRAIAIRANGSLFFNSGVDIQLVQHSGELIHVANGSLFRVNRDNNIIRSSGEAIGVVNGSQVAVYGTLTVSGEVRIRYNSTAEIISSNTDDGVIFENDVNGSRVVKVSENSSLNIEDHTIDELDLEVYLSSVAKMSNVTLTNSGISAERGSHVVLEDVTQSMNVLSSDSTSTIHTDN